MDKDKYNDEYISQEFKQLTQINRCEIKKEIEAYREKSNAMSRRLFLQSVSAVIAAPMVFRLSVTASALFASGQLTAHSLANVLIINPLGYRGERQDPATGGYMLGNGYRLYNPSLMRFHSADSMSPFGKGGANRYMYCLADPINYKDPNGHFPIFSLFMLAMGIVATVLSVKAQQPGASKGLQIAAIVFGFTLAIAGTLYGGYGALMFANNIRNGLVFMNAAHAAASGVKGAMTVTLAALKGFGIASGLGSSVTGITMNSLNYMGKTVAAGKANLAMRIFHFMSSASGILSGGNPLAWTGLFKGKFNAQGGLGFLSARLTDASHATGLYALVGTEPGSEANRTWNTSSFALGMASVYIVNLPNHAISAHKIFSKRGFGGIRDKFVYSAQKTWSIQGDSKSAVSMDVGTYRRIGDIPSRLEIARKIDNVDSTITVNYYLDWL
ncbi:RHS repeat-associated core domain-containing protein [Vibrio aestuarianus]|nr:RHS repeat-associated core domain-containing protein [Vibrio aestuarianus]MDE1214674.1 RHS repeat-associated core domain-containing protein [Vibrio aestuarianus]MDE1269482.1 RHS repeat-associated core domain-containing protein [Vibrio aestuarianus]MDE1279686.1 RHS repeat-associated core domain-containing protein [Vibrio aestuarianus]MDE1301649.1 RHS repeat-associated core domain-containing protein [Vibrio aestuarianus]MDE1322565.1 RHS repeat-associated core domain-containing protein [Vibrio